MRKLWLPLLCDRDSFLADNAGGSFFGGVEPYKAFYDKEKARVFAKELATSHPNSKVVLFEAHGMVEPRRIEFAEKFYNGEGELVV